MQVSAETVSRLLGLLYEASASTGAWSGFLSEMAAYTESESSYFLLVDTHGRCNFNLTYGFDPWWARLYQSYFCRHDTVFNRFVAAKRLHGEWAGTRFSVIPRQDYLKSHLYNGFTRPQRKLPMCMVALGGLEGGLEGGLGLMRPQEYEPYGKETVELIGLLAPHLRQALNTHRLLAQARTRNAELQHSVEALDMAVVSLDYAGRVVRMSTTAQAILERRDGLAMDGDFLRAQLPGEQAKLRETIAGAVATGAGRVEEVVVQRSTRTAPQAGNDPLWTPSAGGAMEISRAKGHAPLRVVVTPFHSSELLLMDQPAALAFISDPEAHTARRATVLCVLYKLTPAECRLADLLTGGLALAGAAAQMHVTVETARFHLKSIFRKTGVKRQSELVRAVLNLPHV